MSELESYSFNIVESESVILSLVSNYNWYMYS